MTLLTFIIPVRHQDNARDWSLLKANLTQTVGSIANQTNGDWRAIIVANHGADLPDLPKRFSVERVDFLPNDMHELGSADRETVLDAFRADKGRRVLAGMLAARDSRFFMIVDDDDFVSAHLVQYVSEHADAPGWTIDRGYIWTMAASSSSAPTASIIFAAPASSCPRWPMNCRHASRKPRSTGSSRCSAAMSSCPGYWPSGVPR